MSCAPISFSHFHLYILDPPPMHYRECHNWRQQDARREFQVAGAAQLKDRFRMSFRLLWRAHREMEQPMTVTAVTECRWVPWWHADWDTPVFGCWCMPYLERCLLHVTGLYRVRTTMRGVGTVSADDTWRGFTPPMDAARSNHKNTHYWTTIQATSERASRPTSQSRRRKWIFMTPWSRDQTLHVFIGSWIWQTLSSGYRHPVFGAVPN